MRLNDIRTEMVNHFGSPILEQDEPSETAEFSKVEPWDDFINDSLENAPIDAGREESTRSSSNDSQGACAIHAQLMARFFAELEKINDLHRTNLHPEHCVVLLQMYLDLYDKGDAFNIVMNTNPSDADRMVLAATFKTEIQAIIQNGEEKLQQEPGLLGKLHPIIKGILAVLATLVTGIVVLPIAMEMAKRTLFIRHGYVNTFFKARPEAELTERAFNQTRVKQQLLGHTPSDETGILDEIRELVKPMGSNQ